MKRILCYGDSLTWGFIPGTMGKRYGPEVRWPRRVQGLLRSDYEIIEEALNGRTTVWEDSFREGRHGARLLQPLLESHGPLDLVIIMLGSNDLLHYRDVLAVDVARGMVNLLDIVERTITECQQQPPAVLLISPPGGAKLTPEMATHCRGDLAKFAELPAAFEQLARDRGCSFLDAARVVESAEVADGIHMNEPGNRKLAEQVAARIREILG